MDKLPLFIVGYLCFLGGLGIGVALMDGANAERRREDQLAAMRKIADDAAANPEAVPRPPADVERAINGRRLTYTGRSGVPGHSL